MIRQVVIRPDAERDLSNTFRWYEEQSPGLGHDFLRAVEVSLGSVQRHPLAFSQVHRQIRRVLLRRFPYGIFYLVHRHTLVVLACFHFKRSPNTLLPRFPLD